jgi:hypothetical protein
MSEASGEAMGDPDFFQGFRQIDFPFNSNQKVGRNA